MLGITSQSGYADNFLMDCQGQDGCACYYKEHIELIASDLHRLDLCEMELAQKNLFISDKIGTIESIPPFYAQPVFIGSSFLVGIVFGFLGAKE